MKLLKGISLFASAVLFLSSCGGGGGSIASNEFVKQLPDDQKAVFVKSMKSTCDCFGKMKGDVSKVEAAAKTLEAKADEFVAAVEAGDAAKAIAADEAMTEARKNFSETQKAFQGENKEMGECIMSVGKDMSDADQELLTKAQKKLDELSKAKFGDTPEGKKKEKEMAAQICPASAKLSGFQETMGRVYEKSNSVSEKFMEMKMNAIMNPGGTDEDPGTGETEENAG